MTLSGPTLALLLLSGAEHDRVRPPQVMLAQVINGESTYENNYIHTPPPGRTGPAPTRSNARDATPGSAPAVPDAPARPQPTPE